MTFFLEAVGDLGQKLSNVLWNSLDDFYSSQDWFLSDIGWTVAKTLQWWDILPWGHRDEDPWPIQKYRFHSARKEQDQLCCYYCSSGRYECGLLPSSATQTFRGTVESDLTPNSLTQITNTLFDKRISGDKFETLHLSEVGFLTWHVDEEQLGDISGT